MSKRYDKRTESQFKKDIKSCSKIEKDLMYKYVDWLNKRPGKRKYTVIDNGVDNSGNFIEKDSDVSLDADFILRADNQKDRIIEIKHCRPMRNKFHLKINHLKSYIKNDVCIVNWMGIDTDTPKFCIITPQEMEKSLINKKPVKMWSKWCIAFTDKDVQWITP